MLIVCVSLSLAVYPPAIHSLTQPFIHSRSHSFTHPGSEELACHELLVGGVAAAGRVPLWHHSTLMMQLLGGTETVSMAV